MQGHPKARARTNWYYTHSQKQDNFIEFVLSQIIAQFIAHRAEADNDMQLISYFKVKKLHGTHIFLITRFSAEGHRNLINLIPTDKTTDFSIVDQVVYIFEELLIHYGLLIE